LLLRARESACVPPCWLPGQPPSLRAREVEVIDIEETDEAVDLVERVCALDIGKVALTACIRVPRDDKPGHRRRKCGSMPRPPGRCWNWPTGCTLLA
jgi:hypothetical protein